MFYFIVRNLAGEIAQEYVQRQVGLLANLNDNVFISFSSLISLTIVFFFVLLQSEEAPIDDLIELVRQIVAFHMKV
jgi:hypothetical protein